MLDAYYGYDDDGLVRTNLAGGVDKKQLAAERGTDAVNELDRLGALTGVADTSGKKKDIYFCHSLCELGAVSAQEVLGNIRDFLEPAPHRCRDHRHRGLRQAARLQAGADRR